RNREDQGSEVSQLKSNPVMPSIDGPKESGKRVDAVASAGAAVLALSAIGFLGLLIRDLLLVKGISIGAHLDAYFTATMLPMFLVSFLSQPIADSFIQPFIACYDSGTDRAGASRQFVGSVVSFVCIVCAVGSLPFWLFPEAILSLFHKDIDMTEAAFMLRAFTVIFLFSGIAVVGNASLNALQQSGTAAVAQLVVPFTAITSILFWDTQRPSYSAIFGMILGQILNIAWVWYALGKKGVTLFPGRIIQSPVFSRMRSNYVVLSAVSFLSVSLTPINYAFAGALDHGSLSVWAMGNKMTLLFVNVGAVIITSVLLPHLAKLISRGESNLFKGDVFFLFSIGSFASFLMSFVIFVFSEPLFFALFDGNNFSIEQTQRLVWVLRMGCLQLPFLFASTMCLKLTAISKVTVQIVLISIMGLFINVLLDFSLIHSFGVLGVAIASVAATACSATLLLLSVRRRCGLSLVECGALVLSWWLVSIAALGFYLHRPGMVAVCLTGVASAFGLQAVLWYKHQKRFTLPTDSIQAVPIEGGNTPANTL
ncbi:MAG: lipid II flippase MurJ, partial [Alphaproteobacteria bacterium]